MGISSLLKSPSAMGGAGMIGSGGVGVGGWQIYEGVNPTTHRQLSRQGYRWNPAAVPLNEPFNANHSNKYNWKNWGCIEKLFPGLKDQIKHDETNTPTTTVTKISSTTENLTTKTIYFKQDKQVTDELLTCALLDWRQGTNKVYFKSEVVVKDKERGWVMWNGLSTTTDKKVTFEYRLLLFEKESNENWKIKTGWAWNTPESTRTENSLNKLVIDLPKGQSWTWTYDNIGRDYHTRKVWSGIALVDKSKTTTQTDEEQKGHLLDTMNIFINNNPDLPYQKAEFFGRQDGKFHESDAGFKKTHQTYNDGWKKLSTEIDLGDSIEEWYKPFMEKKVMWITCDSWSGNRRAPSQSDSLDKTMMEMCYQKPNS